MLSFAKSRIAGNKLFILYVALVLSLNLYGQTEIKELSLNEAIEIGLKNNPEVKRAMENISASKGRFWSGISLPQPEVGVSYEYAPVNSSLSNYNEKTLAVSQSFEFPTNYFLKGSKFNKEEEVAAYKLNLVERSVINQIKTNYYKALAKQYQIKSAEENLVISEDFFKKAEIRQNVGEGTNLERLTAKVQYTEARNNLEVAKNELTTAFAELNYSLGFGKQSYDSNFSLTDSLVFVDHNISLVQIYKSFEETNPQIKIAELEYGISSVEKSLAWSSLLPNINLSYFKQARDGDNGFYGASFGVSVPLWFMFDQRGKIQEAVANQSISESELQLTKNEVVLKLKSAFTDHENNLKQVKLYVNDILPQAEEIYRTAIKSYDAGELTYLEYLQAKQTLISSRNNYINALFNHYQSVFRIEEIVGQNIIDKSELEK
ncbi:MAG: TolC family protein [Ignavibacteria bacterium]|nr:TolC family protein [Ignavibacteria bacterium]